MKMHYHKVIHHNHNLIFTAATHSCRVMDSKAPLALRWMDCKTSSAGSSNSGWTRRSVVTLRLITCIITTPGSGSVDGFDPGRRAASAGGLRAAPSDSLDRPDGSERNQRPAAAARPAVPPGRRLGEAAHLKGSG